MSIFATEGYELPVYNIRGSLRQHLTASAMVVADGTVTAIRIVWSGKRWSAVETDLEKTFPRDGVTGKWKFNKSESGYVNREIFFDILSDLDQHLTTHNMTHIQG